ncbi:peroxisomal membrane protein MPV17 [Emiliania huxleyi CCMP1516]|uniref:Peroxisomal membrane protein MPV17 n=3 Tax=Emiliania huxleyi TaxID=2903 RepID=A0A0D3JKN9_EMIH1|nr:peroxisomal membrane protein MPV17 [Emiliania huxleyi CCMP1516]EOD24074.1 peroxisomal membrane protein MPV17 [Emiliania huxleyi CCMP1516]|eukprot:XP_005776503.1 peroxisomal membrane protein MPV17 [Emiliania huxleyi CCMP1516]
MPLLSAALLSLALPAPRPALPVLRSRVSVLRGGQTAMGLAGALGAAYEAQLSARPLLTQSLTAAATFALSDVTAQRLAPDGAGSDRTRTAVTALIGLCYFGPALYHYLRFITWLIPGTGLQSTLLKTFCGQLGFGPAVTCVFFGAFLVKDHGLAGGLSRLPRKIRQDLVVTWASELCYWPFVDLICYSSVPVRWIPLGYNIANFLWTIFLSLQASKAVRKVRDDT